MHLKNSDHALLRPERAHLTKLDRKIPAEDLETMNNILLQFFDGKENEDPWDINVAIYLSAVSILDSHGKLESSKWERKPINKPGWLRNFENQINGIRRKLSHIDLILKTDPSNVIKNRKVKIRLRKWYGNLKTDNLKYHQCRLKHELKMLKPIF